MRIFEITNKSKRIIRRLQKLYISYTLNHGKYDELVKTLSQTTGDDDVVREIGIIVQKLKDEMIEILKK